MWGRKDTGENRKILGNLWKSPEKMNDGETSGYGSPRREVRKEKPDGRTAEKEPGGIRTRE